jgi:hypothetical protein
MRALILTILIAIFAAFYLPSDSSSGLPANAGNVMAFSTAVHPSTGGCQSPPTLSYTVPLDIAASNSQANVNCLVWQEFIALNWLASPANCEADATVAASSFGQPNNTAPVVWETYKEASEVFQKDAAPPKPWCFADNRKLKTPSPQKYKVFGLDSNRRTSSLDLSHFGQAGTDGAWLTDQNRNLTLYEIRLNADEFNYINTNQLYDASIQQTFVQEPGIDLPDGTARFSQYGHIGSIELKAAWIELPDPSKWPYFKTSKAYVVYPNSKAKPKLVTIGLVGLHIIHKTAKGPQFVWATFEHVNNAPSTTDIKDSTLLPWYSFYNKDCNRETDHYHCLPNGQPSSATPSSPNFPRQPHDPFDAPMQVVRENPINGATFDNVAGLNQWVWNLIRANNPESVFLNYQLVDVLWASAPANVPPGSEVPLTAGNPLPSPSTQKVANTTMETYSQNSVTCLDCHTKAAVASAQGLKKFASDYSFLFSMANMPLPSKPNSARKRP